MTWTFQLKPVDARYRGRSIGSRRISGRGLGPRPADRVGVGRRLSRRRSLLSENDEQSYDDETSPSSASAGCFASAYEVLSTIPELSTMKDIIDTLPIIKSKMQDTTANLTYTLFAPTNDAIEGLKNWEPWEDAKRDLISALGSTRAMRVYLVAYHAVPNVTLSTGDLEALKGDTGEIILEDYLNNIMPLYVDNVSMDVGGLDGPLVVGLGSDARIVEGDFFTCGGTVVVHAIDHVLLPFDGDNALDDTQFERLINATNVMRARRGLAPLDPDVVRNARDDDDPMDAVGAVPIEDVPTEWTKSAHESDEEYSASSSSND